MKWMLPVLVLFMLVASCAATKTDPSNAGIRAGKEISWQQAKRLLEKANVESVGLTHARRIDIRLDEGCYLSTVPSSDLGWVWNTIDHRQKNGEEIVFFAE